jgi:hypothetical protein
MLDACLFVMFVDIERCEGAIVDMASLALLKDLPRTDSHRTGA